LAERDSHFMARCGQVLIGAFRGWTPALLASELVVGLTLAAITIPEQMATAKLAGFAPQVGFYAFIGATIGFAALGASRLITAGADSTISPIFAGSLAVLAAGSASMHASAATTLALIVGAMLIVGGLLKLGWIANLLSRPVVTGFLVGIAVHIMVSQLPSFFGIAQSDGDLVTQVESIAKNFSAINPFTTANSNRFVTGPLVVDADGTLLYNVIELDPVLPTTADAQGWLVRIPPGGSPSMVLYQTLVNGAPAAGDQCPYSFRAGNIPGPYPATVPVPTGPCGSQRPGFNSGPAIGPGGTIFVVSRAHYAQNDSSIVALNPDLTPKWTYRMREILNDGCGVLATNCRQGAPTGVDPSTGLKPSVWVNDQASSVPVALPDGAVLYGGLTTYNGARGHLVKVSPDGKLMGTYDFGWDVTPAVWVHDATYSIITKDNHYFRPPNGQGPYDITQLNRDLGPQWMYTSTETRSCSTEADGGITCQSDHPDGFEWCINAPAVAPDGTVYGNSEDGRIYAIRQGGQLIEQRFLLQSLGAAYTPIAVDSKGRVYSMNGGVMTVVGQ